eukprot:CAMPEP_0173258588 /NCGR_PEP_ID=MMETSP1142-20121109/24466_1 /TAXON_ID=483371 /ORGANISM="non described non described, Strain CCMP2298" /LENGTH=100 /DNA_ID=CAMNT_0014192959 /DNA_START=72 /DNA_END=374 /DNA_ORIENTATION=+
MTSGADCDCDMDGNWDCDSDWGAEGRVAGGEGREGRDSAGAETGAFVWGAGDRGVRVAVDISGRGTFAWAAPGEERRGAGAEDAPTPVSVTLPQGCHALV